MNKYKALYLSFFLSGATALVYQILWVRMLALIFGSTTHSIAVVLAAFMLGLSFGSWYFGKFVDRLPITDYRLPLPLFAFLMLGIGIYCALTPVLFKGIERLYISLASDAESSHYITHYTLHITRFILGFIVIFIPTALMGGTLPVITKYFTTSDSRHTTHDNISQNVGILYSVNTWGAVLGTFLCGYFLIMWLGVKGTLYMASVINLMIGFIVLLVAGGFKMFLSPVGVECESTKNQSYNKYDKKKNGELVHFYSSLPWLGLQKSITGVALINVGLAITIILISGSRRLSIGYGGQK